MFPTLRFYLLLGGGFLIILVLRIFLDNPTTIVATGIYDLIVIILAIWDGLQVNKQKVAVSRKPLSRLSVGRDNVVTLQIESQQPHSVQIKDKYPQQFAVSTEMLEAKLPSAINSQSELQYTISPHSRGEHECCLLYTSPSPRDLSTSRMPSSA